MAEKIILFINKKSIELLRKDKKLPLYKLAEGNCSEVARLIGCKLIKNSKVVILKGQNIPHSRCKSHDILAIRSRIIFLFDPTIWQFFKRKRTTFLGYFSSIEKALAYAEKIYGGHWQVSEKLDKKTCSSANLLKLAKVLSQNLNEVL